MYRSENEALRERLRVAEEEIKRLKEQTENNKKPKFNLWKLMTKEIYTERQDAYRTAGILFACFAFLILIGGGNYRKANLDEAHRIICGMYSDEGKNPTAVNNLYYDNLRGFKQSVLVCEYLAVAGGKKPTYKIVKVKF